jgi:hypothetical protein
MRSTHVQQRIPTDHAEPQAHHGTPRRNRNTLTTGNRHTASRTVWSQQAYLKASNTDGNDQFGRVSLSGDTLAVGAHLEDSSGTGVNSATLANNSAVDSGAVYVYR